MFDIKIEEALKKIREGTKASNLEDHRLEFKAYPKKSPITKKLSRILEECTVAFANAEGGILVLGVEDNVSGPAAFTGCTNYDTAEMKRIIYNNTRPSIMVEIRELETEEGTLLAVYVPESPTIHSTSAGVIYRRVGKENRIIYPEDMTSLKVEKGYDYTAGFPHDVDIGAIDPLEVARLRNWMEKYNPGSELSQLTDEKLLEAMGLLKKSNGRLLPTVACLLLVGREEVLREKMPQCETVFLRFEEDDTRPVQSIYLKSPLLKTIDKIWDMIEPYNTTVTIKDAFFETPVPSFPEDVVREGLLNALTHRDYSLNDAVYIRLYSDRIEISSPGGFVGDVTPDNILTHPPVRRNPLLSEAFQHIGVVNRAGLGVDRMYQRLISYGKMPPEYPYYKDVVVLILRNGSFDETLAKFVGRKAKEGHGWKLDELIIIHYLRRNDRITVTEASKICQKSKKDVSEILTSMEGRLLERFGTGKGTYYQYSKEVFRVLGESAKYTRISGLSEERMLQLIRSHLETYGRITNSEVREICGVNRNQALRLLRKLESQGKAMIKGKTRGAYYEKID